MRSPAVEKLARAIMSGIEVELDVFEQQDGETRAADDLMVSFGLPTLGDDDVIRCIWYRHVSLKQLLQAFADRTEGEHLAANIARLKAIAEHLAQLSEELEAQL
jgi:hypothetical protein